MADPGGAGTGSGPAPRILVVDDSVLNHRLVSRLLGRLGHEAQFAHDGEEAVRACGEQPFDLVLMDVHMPRLDGPEAARAIVAAAAPGRCPRIVALTATADAEDIEACLAAGMAGYVVKPPSLGALRQLLASLRP